MYDVIQIAGSLVILGAFAGALLGKLPQTGYRYLVANAVGSAVLAVTAVIGQEWGFLLLEAVWAIVSTYSILRKATGHPLAAPH
jgi:hypothetical protein